jgi:hypothetical protein
VVGGKAAINGPEQQRRSNENLVFHVHALKGGNCYSQIGMR